MLVGVLVEVVGVVSTVEKEDLEMNYVKTQLLELFEAANRTHDEDLEISRIEIEGMLQQPKACKALQDVGVDVVGLVDFIDFIFHEDASFDFPDFMLMILQLRGTNTATVKDMVD